MTSEQSAAYVNGQSACLMAEVLGMSAENQMRSAKGESPAYVEKDFQDAINKYQCYHNAAVTVFSAVD